MRRGGDGVSRADGLRAPHRESLLSVITHSSLVTTQWSLTSDYPAVLTGTGVCEEVRARLPEVVRRLSRSAVAADDGLIRGHRRVVVDAGREGGRFSVYSLLMKAARLAG